MPAMKILLIAMFSVSLMLTSGFVVEPDIAYAENNTQYQSVNPDNTMRYWFKRFGEKLKLARLGIFSKNKIGDYTVELLEKREKELLYIAENKKLGHLETTSSRYITTVGQITELLELEKVTEDSLINQLDGYKEGLSKTRDLFAANSAQWLLLQQSLDSTNVLLSKAQE